MTEIFTYLRTRVLIKAKIKGKFFSYQIFASHKFAEIRTLQFRGHTHTHTQVIARKLIESLMDQKNKKN